MSRKNRKSRAYVLNDCSEPCQEPITIVKARVKEAKEDLADIVSLAERGTLDYDIRDEVVGRAYMSLVQAKTALRRRKVQK